MRKNLSAKVRGKQASCFSALFATLKFEVRGHSCTSEAIAALALRDSERGTGSLVQPLQASCKMSGFFLTRSGKGKAARVDLRRPRAQPTDRGYPHTVETGGLASGQNGSVIYLGYIHTANPWVRAEFADVGGTGDDFGFDDMTIGSMQQVRPTPDAGATLGLLAMSVAGLAALKPNRK
jgi:hypothetical protein